MGDFRGRGESISIQKNGDMTPPEANSVSSPKINLWESLMCRLSELKTQFVVLCYGGLSCRDAQYADFVGLPERF